MLFDPVQPVKTGFAPGAASQVTPESSGPKTSGSAIA
jgi:hypothetical protein